MMMIRYSYDGMKMVLKQNATHQDLSTRAKQLKKEDWNISWSGNKSFEATHDNVAAGRVYCLKPDDHPLVNGEPV